ncbi:MAG TPA: glycerophosphodiester phosphodiesterase [Candidatus Thalassarchaeaceae archaeon]|nr:MAG TPA: glycerophosphodiester phosphodiesterase [Candidatus Poseidoniales archaeon]HII48353.1 glycerophosphodiester phosphodiesterase [Candidatus Thalassarchaeaceae archaeon]|tara:strand:- start:363 stop:1289 length:927 start_codon:yes stop_codon:yes gene_type:complete
MERRQKILLGIVIFLLLLFSGPRLDSDLGNDWIVGDERPLIIAHRGGADIFPENTMVAFEGAAMIGVDMLEMDFQLTSDNRLITMHDDTVDRTTNGTGLVIDMTLEEILNLDASAKFTNLTGGNPWNDSHLSPVTIEDILDRFIDSPHRLSLEIKNEGEAGEIAAEIMFQEIENREMEDRIEVGSFHIESIQAFREISGGKITTSGVESEIRKCIIIPMLQLDRWWMDPGQVSILQIPTEGGGFDLATEGVVNRAHQHGQAVQYWTINDREMMGHLIDIGADGIMTDDPILLRQAILDAGYTLPEPWV